MNDATANCALIVGATGATGTALVDHLAGESGWKVYGVCRTPPSGGTPFHHIAADLLDPASLKAAFAGLSDVTHVVYAARAVFAEGGVEDVESNAAMLRGVIDAIEPAAANLRHIHLIEGTKWYGSHLGRFRTPAREDDPRHLPPNFYYDQQDLLEERQKTGAGWTWSASRPNVVCDFAPRRPRNLTPIIGAYAAICRELGVRLDFPGIQAGYDTLTDVTDGHLMARGIAWMLTAPAAANQAFNLTNGDIFRWRDMWPVLAEDFGIPCGEPRDILLGNWMADKQPVWERIVKRHGLTQPDLAQVAYWPFGDFVFRQDWDLMSELGRIRRAGFNPCVDSYEMFRRQIGQYREARILP